MNIRPAMRFTPENIVKHQGGINFIVPLYQRLFSWTHNEVYELLCDLKSHFDKWPDAESSDIHYPYYLGIVTTIPDKGRYCLVDGQQRFTVLMIMASVFRRMSYDWRVFFADGNRLELFAREDDTRFLKGLADGITQGKYVNVLMLEAYRVIVDFLAGMDIKEQTLFMERCFSRITLFNSVLPSSYLSEPSSLNKYFEVMNSAGVNLEQHEILKVALLKGQQNQTMLLNIWNICSDFARPIIPKKENVGLGEYSKQYLDLFSQQTDEATKTIMSYNQLSSDTDKDTDHNLTIAEIDIEPQEFNQSLSERNERSILTFPEFLLLTLDIHKNLSGEWSFYKTDRLNERFKEHLLDSPADIPGFYDLLLKLRIALDLYVIRRKIDGQDSEYSLIFQGNDKVENDCLEQYEAMLSVSTPYYKWLKVLFEYVLKPTTHKMSKDLLSLLKRWDNDQHPYPASASSLTYGTIDRYWFWRLDYYLWEQVVLPKDNEEDSEAYRQIKSYRQAITDYIFRANRSIEHLHPQNESNNSSWDRTDIDSFGNLAMISQSFNSQQSNEDVHVKFSRIETQARNKTLQSIKLLRMYILVKGNPDGWTPEAAKRHEEEMMKILSESYSNL